MTQVLRYLQSCGSPSPEDVKDGKEVAAEARLTALAQGFPFLRLHMDLIIKILSSTPPWELLRISAVPPHPLPLPPTALYINVMTKKAMSVPLL